MTNTDPRGSRLGQSHWRWREEPGRLLVTNHGWWRLLIFVSYVIACGALFLPDLAENLATGWLFVCISLSLTVTWFFRGPTRVEISPGRITLRYLGGLTKRTVRDHGRFQVLRQSVGGRMPHDQLRVLSCHPTREPLVLVQIKGLEADAPLDPLLEAMQRIFEGAESTARGLGHGALDTSPAPRGKHQP